MYDYLIVGSGLMGSVLAFLLKEKGKKCLILEKRNHVGGNIYTEQIEGIHVHKYGAHIFHTSDKEVWDFINRFTSFNRYINSPLVWSKGCLYNLPFNMNTFHSLWNIASPQEAMCIIEEQRKPYEHIIPSNLEEQSLRLAGRDIYEVLIKGYSEKQWGKKASELPAFIIKRIPLRFTFDNNYFNDIYQGIPIGGYTSIIEKLISGIDIKLNTNFLDFRNEFKSFAKVILYTGCIDEYFDYCFGRLEYRGRLFKHEIIECENYQGNAVINYADSEIPYIRSIEHKHFEYGTQPTTVVTYEYPESSLYSEPFYSINNFKNTFLYEKYRDLSKLNNNVFFIGRLGEYAYYDMHQIIRKAIDFTNFIEHPNY